MKPAQSERTNYITPQPFALPAHHLLIGSSHFRKSQLEHSLGFQAQPIVFYFFVFVFVFFWSDLFATNFMCSGLFVPTFCCPQKVVSVLLGYRELQNIVNARSFTTNALELFPFQKNTNGQVWNEILLSEMGSTGGRKFWITKSVSSLNWRWRLFLLLKAQFVLQNFWTTLLLPR